MKIAVVILNWNGKSFLEKFLPDVIKYSEPFAQVIIGDNASNDDSIAFINEQFPNIKIIQNSKNYGFAGGYNQVLKQIDADYYVLLNSDIEVTPNWIEPIIDMMENDKSIAAAQPKLLSYLNKKQFEYAGAAGGFIDFLGYPFCRGRIFDSIENDNGQYDDDKQVFWATGAAFFVKADAFHQLGGFDDKFFAHQEEIDLCWRMQNNGYKIMYCPKSVIYHVGGGTLPKSSPFKTFLNFRNNLYMLYKNLPQKQFNKIFVIRIILDFIAMIKIFLSDGTNNANAVIKAYKAFFKNKKNLQKSTTFPNIPTIYSKSILQKYYFGGKKTFQSIISLQHKQQIRP
ncbi:glycosyl transferase family 2 [Bacteroidia bacterium]|nr:glycosyl transferase family 2 [Bacteroidia bacterium]